MIHKLTFNAYHHILWAVTTLIISITFITTVKADVVASIRPLAFIISGIADGVTDTQVLVPNGSSPHDYALKPSDLKKIQQADLFVWISHDMEIFLNKPLKTLSQNKQLVLSEQSNIQSLLIVSNKTGEHNYDYIHSTINKHHKHNHGKYNMHIWMSPEIAKQAALAIHNRLIVLYANQKEILDINLRKFNRNIAKTNKNIIKILKLTKKKKYFVFHDAYGYFEKYYQLAPLGYFTINPGLQFGAKKLHRIRTQLIKNKTKCVFSEPQFSPTIIKTIIKNTGTIMGTLDPLGNKIKIGPESYMQFLTQLSQQYATCLN
ncbi:High-affinity zinc uptake system protein ZnuA [Candidatus Hartigia pinicola]|nr:High-affinity zinc uptake system protein ZnuA [Candidatus Hartigia pinicola]